MQRRPRPWGGSVGRMIVGAIAAMAVARRVSNRCKFRATQCDHFDNPTAHGTAGFAQKLAARWGARPGRDCGPRGA